MPGHQKLRPRRPGSERQHHTQYLLEGDGQTAPATPANRAALGGAAIIENSSDNALLGSFVDVANGCHPFAEPDPTSASGFQSSQALDELSARVNQHAPIALIPPNDEMVLVDGDYSIPKTNVYRSLVDQPLLASGTNAIKVAAAFCMNMVNVAAARDRLDLARDANFCSTTRQANRERKRRASSSPFSFSCGPSMPVRSFTVMRQAK